MPTQGQPTARPTTQVGAGTTVAATGGIVGVASKKDMEGIRLYNERSNYKEWEFLFDRKKAMEAAGMTAGGQAGQQGQQGQQGTQGQGTGQNSTGSPFGSFGGSGSQAAFGARGGATLLTKLTTIFAALFMLGSLVLSVIGQRGPGSVVGGTAAPPPAKSAPLIPAPSTPASTPGPAAPASAPAPGTK